MYDIVKNLDLRNPNIFISSFNRPNLYYEVLPKINKAQTDESIVRFIKGMKTKSGIIYTLNRKTTEELADVLNANGIMKKAIIFDCDNTLWGGILGEDGVENINLSPANKVGAVFSEVQGLALSLKKHQGVLLGLCSKNNLADVDKVTELVEQGIIRRVGETSMVWLGVPLIVEEAS